MRHLAVVHNVVGCRRDTVALGCELLYTRSPRLKAVEAGRIIDFAVLVGNHHEGGDHGKRYHANAHQCPELLEGNTSDEHKYEHGCGQDACRAEVFGEYQRETNQQDTDYVLEGGGVGTVLTLVGGKDVGCCRHHAKLEEFGRLELHEPEVDPPRRFVRARPAGIHHNGEHDAAAEKEQGEGLEETIVDIVHHEDDDGAGGEKGGLLDEGHPEAAALIRQSACRAEHFDEGDDAQEKIDYPYHRVALEEGGYGFGHKLDFGLEG